VLIVQLSVVLVNQFWILDLRFWIDCTHKGMQLGDFGLTILDFSTH
jgi:hypothetical protein